MKPSTLIILLKTAWNQFQRLFRALSHRKFGKQKLVSKKKYCHSNYKFWYVLCDFSYWHLVLPVFSCVGVRLVYWSLRSTATFVICFRWSLLLAFYLHFSSSSAFFGSIFKQSSYLSCDLPRFLQPSCFFDSDLFGNLSSFILTMCPANFIRLFNYFANCTSFSSYFFSQVFHSPSLILHMKTMRSCEWDKSLA